MEIRLRPGGLRDLRALYALDQACFRQGIAYSLAEMRHFLSRPRSISLVAEDEVARLAGFALAEASSGSRTCTGHIVTIDVSTDFRRRGIGRLLMQTIEARLVEAGAERIRLEVAIDDDGAQQFYLRLGYHASGQIRGYYPGKLDALVMEKSKTRTAL